MQGPFFKLGEHKSLIKDYVRAQADSSGSLSSESFAEDWVKNHGRDPDLINISAGLTSDTPSAQALEVNHALQEKVANLLVSVLKEEGKIRPHSLRLIKRFTRDFFKAQFDSINALLDALFMSRRRHSVEGQITNAAYMCGVAFMLDLHVP